MGNNILVFSPDLIVLFSDTVKPVLSGHLKIDIIKVLMENGSVMKVESIAECYCRMLPLEHSAILLTCIKQFGVIFE